MSAGLCYSCRHISATVTHCYGSGDLEPTEAVPGNSLAWPGFTCTCDCRNSDTINLPALAAGAPPKDGG